jgi:hypothetical protein
MTHNLPVDTRHPITVRPKSGCWFPKEAIAARKVVKEILEAFERKYPHSGKK